MPTTEASKERKLQARDIPGQIDPDVVIPASVRAAAARAEAAHKAAYPDKNSVSPPTADGSPPPSATAATEPTGKPSAGAPSSPQSANGAPAPSSAPPAAEPQAPASAPAGEQQSPPNWEHQFRSMKGRHDKAQDEIRRMGEQITNLQNVLATVQSMPTQASTPSHTPKELRAESLLTPQEVQDYGEEFLEVVGKKAREISAQHVSELENKIERLERQLGQVGGTIAQTGRERMFATLDQQLPQWRDINNNRKFIEWLALPDTYSGAIRHNLLKAAWDRNDTARSLAFFKGFLAEEAAVDPAERPPNGSVPLGQAPHLTSQGNGQHPGPGQGNGNGKVPLETFAAPGRAKSAAEIPAEKPLITRSQISAFYAQCAAGKFRGNEAERVRLENMIFEAQADGRIVN